MTPVALITGAACRVGRGVAERLAAAGFDIAFTYFHSETEAKDLEQQLRAGGRGALAIQCDLTRPQESTEAVFSAFQKQFTRLDLLVNNASIYQLSGLHRTTIEQMRMFFAIHVESPLLLARRFEPMLREAGGLIVSMSDGMAERPAPAYLAYCTSKAALSNLTKGLARELAPQVRVNAIAPGVVEWPPEMPQTEREQYLKRVPLARAGSPEDVAELILFLATTGRYITGQIIPLDGGRSIA
jgi:pteridine reductase